MLMLNVTIPGPGDSSELRTFELDSGISKTVREKSVVTEGADLCCVHTDNTAALEMPKLSRFLMRI